MSTKRLVALWAFLVVLTCVVYTIVLGYSESRGDLGIFVAIAIGWYFIIRRYAILRDWYWVIPWFISYAIVLPLYFIFAGSLNPGLVLVIGFVLALLVMTLAIGLRKS